jgi:hypothetical protein
MLPKSLVSLVGVLLVKHCDGKRYVVRADEKLTAFLELEAVICRRDQIND